MPIAPDVSGPIVQLNLGVTTSTLNITTAATGAWVYAWISISTGTTTQTGIPSATGWTVVASAQTAAGTSGETGAILRRQKQAGDTTFTVNWTNAAKGVLLWQSYTGVDPGTPDENAAVVVNDTTSRAAVPSPTATPSGAGRWAVAFYGQRSTSSISKPVSWTADASLTDRVQGNNSPAASAAWLSGDIEDSNAAVAQTAQSYTATSNVSQSHDSSGILFLVPPAAAPAATVRPARLAPPRAARGRLAVVLAPFPGPASTPTPATVRPARLAPRPGRRGQLATVLAPFPAPAPPSTPTPATVRPARLAPPRRGRGRLRTVLAPFPPFIPPVTGFPQIPPDILKPWRKHPWPRHSAAPHPNEVLEVITRESETLFPPGVSDAPAQAPGPPEQGPGLRGGAAGAVADLARAAKARAAAAAQTGRALQNPAVAEAVLYWQMRRDKRSK